MAEFSSMYVKIKKYKENFTRSYLQLVESFREGDKVRNRIVLNLGRLDNNESVERVNDFMRLLAPFSSHGRDSIDLEKDLTPMCTRQYGPLVVFQKLWQELKLDKLLKDSFQELHTVFDLERAIFNLVLNRLVAPSSKRQMTTFQDSVYGMKQLELHQYYRAMDYLVDHKEDIEKKLFKLMSGQVKGKVQMALFDTTSIVYYGEEAESELLNYGFSKARRSDLRQIVVGVIMSEDGIPLGHETFAGNCNDVSCFKKIIEKVAQKFDLKKLIWVGDRGMISKKNIQLLNSMDFEYVLGYRMRTISKSERSEIFDKADLKDLKNTKLKYKEVEYEGQRLIFCYNEERALKDAKHRLEILERLKDKLKTGKIDSLIENKDYKKFLDIEGKSPSLSDVKIKKDELFDGIFVITSNATLTPPQVVETYKNLWQIEQGFRQLKDELELGPIYHYTDDRIRAHVMICFFALILRRLLDKKLKKLEKTLSYLSCVEDLKRLDVVELKIKDSEMHLLTEIKLGAKKIFKAMDLCLPSKILYQSDRNQKTVVPRLATK